MNKLNKLLWCMFNAVICMVYKDAFGATCSYVITASTRLSNTVAETTVDGKQVANINFATCSAATICKYDRNGNSKDSNLCGGVWARYENFAELNTAPEFTIASRELCTGPHSGYFVSSGTCGLDSCSYACTSCPDGGLASKSWIRTIDGHDYFPGKAYICGQQNPIDGSALNGVYMMEIGISCTDDTMGAFYDQTACYWNKDSFRSDSRGDFQLKANCFYTAS